MLVDKWDSLVVPQDLTAFSYEASWLVSNPVLAAWALLPAWEYEVLRILARRGDRASALDALAARFAESRSAAQLRLEKALARYVLAWIVYLPDHLPIIRMPEPRLRTVYYAVTEGCNLRCTYCYASAARARRGELATLEALDLVDQAGDMRCEEFIFTGGEPFLRRDIFELAARSRARGMRTNVITNATVIKTREMAARVAAHFDLVTVSIDGGTAPVHEQTRGKGTFKVVARALRELNDAGVVPKINHVVTPDNVDHLEETLAFLSRFRIQQMRMPLHGPLGRGRLDGRDVDWTTYLKVHRFAWESPAAKKVLADGPRLPKPGSMRFNCGLAGSEIYVDSVGDVYPCKLVTFARQKAGNVRENLLREIYLRSVFEDLRAGSVETFAGCESCYVRGACGGGCRAYHAGYSGDLATNAMRFCKILRHMIVTRMWAASGMTGDALLDPEGSAYVPAKVNETSGGHDVLARN